MGESKRRGIAGKSVYQGGLHKSIPTERNGRVGKGRKAARDGVDASVTSSLGRFNRKGGVARGKNKIFCRVILSG